MSKAIRGGLLLRVLWLLPHFRRQGLDLRQVTLHLAPAIPQRIIRVGMKCALKRPHSMFEEHHKQLLLDDRGCVVESQQIRELLRQKGLAPAALSQGLDQEHVVLIHVWSD